MLPRMIFFDCDGVLVLQNLWRRMHGFMGVPDELEERWFRANRAGTLSEAQWLLNIASYYRERGFSLAHCDQAYGAIELNPEAPELLAGIQARGIPTAVISSGMSEYVRRVAALAGIPTWRCNATPVFHADGTLDRFDLAGPDVDVKVQQVLEICAASGIDPRDTIHIGDSHNDVGVFDLTGHGVYYRGEDPCHAHRAWRTADDLRDVLGYLDAFP